jgi:hypothetical protein
MIVGYLIFGNFVCKDCAPMLQGSPGCIPVHDENIGLYSQSCSRCKAQTIRGVFSTELFSSTFKFGRKDLDALVASLEAARESEDIEAFESHRLTIYEAMVLAIMGGELEDRDYVFETVRKMFK